MFALRFSLLRWGWGTYEPPSTRPSLFATRTQKDPKTGFRGIQLLFGSFLRRPFVSDPADVLCLRLRVFLPPFAVFSLFWTPLCVFFLRGPSSTRADRFSRPPFGGYPPSLISVGIVRGAPNKSEFNFSPDSGERRTEIKHVKKRKLLKQYRPQYSSFFVYLTTSSNYF